MFVHAVSRNVSALRAQSSQHEPIWSRLSARQNVRPYRSVATRFLHTADWQMGMRALHAGAAADAVRAARFEAAERVVAAAREHNVEFLLVAGDTFEDNAVDRSMVAKVAEILASARCPVYVISGNHDPLVPGSVWADHCWSHVPTVHILREEVPVEVNSLVTLWPGVARTKHDERDPTAWIRTEDPSRVHIIIAHGTVEAVHREEPWYPIARDAPERTGADFIALGHFHGYTPYLARDGAARMAYCGTHEPTRFGERSVGSVLLVEIEKPRAAPRLTMLQTGKLTWVVKEATLRDSGDVASVHAELNNLDSPEKSLVRLRLYGHLRVDEQEALESLANTVRTRFLDGRVESFLRLAPTDLRWTALLPEGPARETASRLARWAEVECVDRPTGVTAEVATRALLELFALAGDDHTDDEAVDDAPIPSRKHRSSKPRSKAGR